MKGYITCDGEHYCDVNWLHETESTYNTCFGTFRKTDMFWIVDSKYKLVLL